MKIDKEFADLIPPLTADEYKGLETSILAEGCRDALIVWNDTLVDGHNRYKICTEHNVAFRTASKDFDDRNAAMLWMMNNQLGRRNLNDFQRVEIVRKCENAVKAKAKERQVAGLIQNADTVREKLPEREQEEKRATDELGAMAKVSRKTYEHAITVIDKAPEAVIQAVRLGELSINAGYEVTKLAPNEQSEIAERIKSGEKPAQAVSQVRKRISAGKKTRNGLVLHLPPEDMERIKILAQNSNIDISAMCVMLIHEALQGQGL